MAILVVAVALRAVRMTTATTHRAAASVVPHVVAMTVVVSVVALAVVSLAVTTVVLLPVVKAVAVLQVVMTVVATVVLHRVVTEKVTAASLALVTQAVVALLRVAMRVHHAVISRHASRHLPSPLVVAASLSWPMTPASARHAPRVDAHCQRALPSAVKAGSARCQPFFMAATLRGQL